MYYCYMKKLLLILLCLPLLLKSQEEGGESILFDSKILIDETVNKGTNKDPILYYESKVYTGKIFDVWTNGNKRIIKTIKDGKEMGEFKNWFSNGQIETQGKILNGKKDGSYKQWFMDGQIEYDINYKNGEFNGSYKQWFKDGQIEYDINYINGDLHGSYKKWFNDGQLEYDKNYKKGKLDGEYLAYSKISIGFLRWEMTYKNGKKNGLRRLWSNNDLLEEGQYVMGKENGLHRKTWRHSTYDHFIPDRYILCYYQNGEKHGDYKKFDEKIIEAGKYINDKKEEKWKEWYSYDVDDGPHVKEWLKKVGNYKNGEKNGAFEEYYVSGEKKLSTTYLNDKTNGIHKEWGEDGKLEVVYFYDNGNQDQTKVWWSSVNIGDKSSDKIIKGQALYAKKNYIYLGKIPSEKWKYYDDPYFSGTGYKFNTNGNIIQEINCLNGQIQLQLLYFDNGKLSAENKYDDGECVEKVSYTFREDINGVFERMTGGKFVNKLKDKMEYEKEFWSNDVLIWRSLWSSGKKNGLSKKWHENGQIEEEGQYIDGKRDGLHKEWYENGNIKSERNWNSDIPIGTFTTYFINGKKETEAIHEDGKLHGKFKRWHENGVVVEEIKYKKGEITKRKCRSIENKKIHCSE